MKERIFEKFAEIKVYGDVGRYYLAILTFILVLMGYIRNSEYSTLVDILIYTILSIVLFLIVHFHIKYIMSKEMGILSRKNPLMTEVLDRLKRIEERL